MDANNMTRWDSVQFPGFQKQRNDASEYRQSKLSSESPMPELEFITGSSKFRSATGFMQRMTQGSALDFKLIGLKGERARDCILDFWCRDAHGDSS